MSDTVLTDVCFENFAIHPLLLKGLEEAGFIRCTPIQAMTLPVTLAGKDVAGQAHTGSGKTAAFLVAAYNRLLNEPAMPQRRAQDPRMVVIAPTRELAVQIEKDARQIGVHTDIRLALIYGGVDYDKQRATLRAGVDLIIATPGRLIDYIKQDVVSFHAIELVVMDEADRMFELGFIKDIRFLLRHMPGPSERQNLLFSATLSNRVLELAYEHMNDPEKMVVENEKITASSVRQCVYFPGTEEKLPLLLGILSRTDANRSMVFVNTKWACERVALTLERAGYKVGVLSGDVPQKKRESLLRRFIQGDLSLLVATDVAARGLHIPDVSHVYNFDLPFDAEDYVHRIGRTARLGAEGDAISLACDEYAMSLPDIEKFIDQKIPVLSITEDLLLPLPPRQRRLNEAGEVRESVIEDAMADAAEERRKRRDRDQRDGRGRSAGSHTGSRAGGVGTHSGRRGQTARPRAAKPRDGEQAAAARSVNQPSRVTQTPAADNSERPKRHRRGRGKRKPVGEEATQQTAGRSTEAHAESASVPTPKLSMRIKQTFRSLARHFGMSGRRG